MIAKASSSIFTTLLVARYAVASPANQAFLSSLTYTLPWRWDERLPREGVLVDTFPGVRAARMVDGITWCREAAAEERAMAEEDGWTEEDGGPTGEYLRDMDENVRLQEAELAAL